MQLIDVDKLNPHPRNRELFDDIDGDKWEDFKNSITRRGVVEPIVVTQDLTIVSGHQRVQACKALGITAVPCRITHYPEKDERSGNNRDDMILEDLICTNLMQRGVGNVNPMKMARCIQELERIYGIRNGGSGFGGNQHVKNEELSHNDKAPKTQEELAETLGLSVSQLHRYKQLINLIPELQELVEKDRLKPTVAHKILAKLPEDEQEEILSKLNSNALSRMTQKEVEKYIEIHRQEKEQLLNKTKMLEQQLQQEKSKEYKIIEKEVVVDNTDYESVNKLTLQLEKEKADNKILENKIIKLETKRSEYEKRLDEVDKETKNEQIEIEKLKRRREKLELQAHISISDLQIKIHNFINDASPSIFLQGAVASSSFKLKDDLLDSVIALEEFTKTLRELLNAKIIPDQNNIIELN